MIAIDSNIVLRYLLNDDVAQARAVRRLLDETCSQADPAFVHDVVLEIVWTLRRRRSSRPDIVGVLRSLLDHAHLVFADDTALAAAIDAYETGPADFPEYLVAASARNRGASPTVTFDADAAKSSAFELLQP